MPSSSTKHPGERLGLGLARVLHRRDDREVGDRARLRAGRPRARRRARSRRSGSSPCRRRRSGRRPGTAARGAGSRRWPARPASVDAGDRVPVGDRRDVVHHRDRLGGRAGVVAVDLGLLAGDEAVDVGDVADPRAPASGAPPACPSLMASIDPASTACSSGVVGAVEADEARTRTDGRAGAARSASATQVHDSTVPAGPTSTKSWASSAPVAGSHSIGGTSTASPLRIPRIRCSVSAVMNAPITGPSDRLYGNVMVWTACATRASPRRSGLMSGD